MSADERGAGGMHWSRRQRDGPGGGPANQRRRRAHSRELTERAVDTPELRKLVAASLRRQGPATTRHPRTTSIGKDVGWERGSKPVQAHIGSGTKDNTGRHTVGRRLRAAAGGTPELMEGSETESNPEVGRPRHPFPQVADSEDSEGGWWPIARLDGCPDVGEPAHDGARQGTSDEDVG